MRIASNFTSMFIAGAMVVVAATVVNVGVTNTVQAKTVCNAQGKCWTATQCPDPLKKGWACAIHAPREKLKKIKAKGYSIPSKTGKLSTRKPAKISN